MRTSGYCVFDELFVRSLFGSAGRLQHLKTRRLRVNHSCRRMCLRYSTLPTIVFHVVGVYTVLNNNNKATSRHSNKLFRPFLRKCSQYRGHMPVILTDKDIYFDFEVDCKWLFNYYLIATHVKKSGDNRIAIT